MPAPCMYDGLTGQSITNCPDMLWMTGHRARALSFDAVRNCARILVCWCICNVAVTHSIYCIRTVGIITRLSHKYVCWWILQSHPFKLITRLSHKYVCWRIRRPTSLTRFLLSICSSWVVTCERIREFCCSLLAMRRSLAALNIHNTLFYRTISVYVAREGPH